MVNMLTNAMFLIKSPMLMLVKGSDVPKVNAFPKVNVFPAVYILLPKLGFAGVCLVNVVQNVCMLLLFVEIRATAVTAVSYCPKAKRSLKTFLPN